MKFGLHLGSRGVAGNPDTLIAVAKKAEELGFEHIGISDHVVVATDVDSKYPYSETGKFYAQETGICLEQLTTLGFLAAATSRIRLLTSVMVLPHRHPVLAAKMLTTVDVLSKGRLTVGVGVGWMAEEMELLGAPIFGARAKASEEYLAAFKELWTKDMPELHGKFACFDKLKFEPKPVQRPGPPIWIGGEFPAARLRAGRLADAWYPVAVNPSHPLDTPALYASGLAEARGAAEAAGRKPADLQAALLAIHCRVGSKTRGRDGKRLAFSGTATEIAGDIKAFRDRGLQQLVVGGDGDDLAGTIARLEKFAESVMARVK